MPTIENLRLTLSEKGGRSTAVVDYDLKGPDLPLGEKQRYVVVVQLMGVDSRPEEDGIDDFIPNGNSAELLLLPLADPRKTHIFHLRPGDLDEDRSLSPIAANFLEDEILARVTVRPVIIPLVADSNVVTRGGPIVKKLAEIPA